MSFNPKTSPSGWYWYETAKELKPGQETWIKEAYTPVYFAKIVYQDERSECLEVRGVWCSLKEMPGRLIGPMRSPGQHSSDVVLEDKFGADREEHPTDAES